MAFRGCDNPLPQNNGIYCQGEVSKSASCIVKPCPVDGAWNSWIEWGACSTTCQTGFRIRSRVCDKPANAHGGKPCPGSFNDNITCFERECPVDGGMSDWSEWSTCSHSCGNGTQTRNRTCTNPTPLYGGAYCMEDSSEDQLCLVVNCPINGNWSDWAAWGACDVTCGNGTMTRRRSCDNPQPIFGGADCVGNETDVTECPDKCCPVDGNWALWYPWSPCQGNCSKGTRSRFRNCDNPRQACGGNHCIGVYRQTDDTCLPIDCRTTPTTTNAPITTDTATSAGPDSTATTSASGASIAVSTVTGGLTDTTIVAATTKTSTTTVATTTASAGFQPLVDCDFEDNTLCTSWHNAKGADDFDWTLHKQQTATDGTGPQNDHTFGNSSGTYIYIESSSPRQTNEKAWLESQWIAARHPLCLSFWFSMYGSSIGQLNIYEYDGSQRPGKIAWSLDGNQGNKWQQANVPLTSNVIFSVIIEATVGNGYLGDVAIDDILLDDRHCNMLPESANPSVYTTMLHTTVSHTSQQQAFTSTTPVTHISGWSAWFHGPCSVTCGTGSQTRLRHCNTGHVVDCPGNKTETIACQMKSCPAWSSWFNLPCSTTCGNGTRTRLRHCSSGHVDDCSGKNMDTVTCNMTPCTVHGGWSSWSAWSQCDVTCENGHVQRMRTCTNPVPAHGGHDCSGNGFEMLQCSLATCPSWTAWFDGDCSVTCGVGTMSRLRFCSTGNDEDCLGSPFDSYSCTKPGC
ncbi:coadhesin-like [Mya arenaria]|uniref:coadhesin-like n=1 Tax=Mya arenaria TaxID=6604 RepID=UPI0022E2D47B|nr:coadhesin-like [Mya arenaria]